MSNPASLPTFSSTPVTTGAQVDIRQFIWRIENFAVVKQSDELLNSQKFDFVIGESIGLPSNFSCYLQRRTPSTLSDSEIPAVKSSNGIYYELKKKPEGVKEINVGFRFEFVHEDGVKSSPVGNVDCKNFLDGEGKNWSWGFALRDNQHYPLTDGSLVIRTTFRLYSTKRASYDDSDSNLDDFLIKSHLDASGAIGKLLEPAAPFADATIISRDGTEFPVHRCILTARNEVFRMIFMSNMTESHTGVVQLRDLSSEATRVLLHYLYTGVLLPAWSNSNILPELIYAAEKYQLQSLIAFLDNQMGKVCTPDNVAKLLVLARKMYLKNAEKQLISYIHQSKPESLYTILEKAMDTDEPQVD